MTSSLPPTAIDAFICPLLKTGRDGCSARFDRSLYQLVLSHEEGEKTVDLGFSGSRVLERLLQTPGEVVSRGELMSYAWEDRVVGQGSLSQQIYTLRQILFDGRNQIIQTLPRRGYLFNPQYLHSTDSSTPAPPADAPAARPTVVIELPTPSARPTMSPVPARRSRPSLRTLVLAGTGLSLLIGMTLLGMRLANLSPGPSFTHKRHVGELEVLYVETNQRLLDLLIKETGMLVDKLGEISAKPARLIVNMSPGFYEVRCLQGDGRVNWLKVHKAQIRTVTTEHLHGCLR